MLLFACKVKLISRFKILDLFKNKFFKDFRSTTKIGNGSVIFNLLLLPFLKMGTIFETFHCSGITPNLKILLNRWVRGSSSRSFESFSIQTGIRSKPSHFLFGKEFKHSLTSNFFIKFLLTTISLFLPLYTLASTLLVRTKLLTLSLKCLAKLLATSFTATALPPSCFVWFCYHLIISSILF